MKDKIYTVAGVGLGPFNLGMAALLEPVEDVSAILFDQSEQFDWHPGLMFDEATLQTPFLCDCVSMADPTSKFSFLNFMKETGRLYKFFIRENFFVLRKEYNLYCQWVANQLDNCKFGHKVVAISYGEGLYEISVLEKSTKKVKKVYAQKLVLGTGTEPIIPDFIEKNKMPEVIHTSEYLYKKKKILKSGSITVVGSGQSAGEVFYDLLKEKREELQLNWFTRPDRLFPMEYSKLTLELTSPDFVNYFHDMPVEVRANMLVRQKSQFKGINYDLINEIYDALYEKSVGNKPVQVRIQPSSQLDHIEMNYGGAYEMTFTEMDQGGQFNVTSDYVVLATGYKYKEPAFLENINYLISRMKGGDFDVKRNYSIDNNNSVFVQNAETHTHSLISSDLGMGAYRNSYIINEITGREVYKVEEKIAFQDFGVDKKEAIPHKEMAQL